MADLSDPENSHQSKGMVAWKTTGVNCMNDVHAAMLDEACPNAMHIIVDDDQHAELSPTASTSFVFQGRVYSSVLDAYHHADPTALFDILYARYAQDQSFRILLDSTTALLVHKSTDQMLGSRVPEFDGQNQVGRMLVQIRDQARFAHLY